MFSNPPKRGVGVGVLTVLRLGVGVGPHQRGGRPSVLDHLLGEGEAKDPLLLHLPGKRREDG